MFPGTGNQHKTVLPGDKYAVGKFEGNDRDIAESWAWLIRDCLPDSGMQLESRPFFEHYPVSSNYDEATGRFECEICIPVMPL
jgi:AraC family transcriptional regulator